MFLSPCRSGECVWQIRKTEICRYAGYMQGVHTKVKAGDFDVPTIIICIHTCTHKHMHTHEYT